VKVGDLVRLSSRKTRRGIGYEDKIGIVLKVAINNVVTVDFAGVRVYLGIEDVEVVSESR
tara:strand:- start:69 stop:248 length:180 start_codon:yes stop_codon:yes gene_type:complete